MSKEAHLEKLKQKQAALTARIQKVEAQTREDSKKKETRQKILVGAYYLERAKEAGTLEALRQELAPYLTRNSDRTLFNLPLLPSER